MSYIVNEIKEFILQELDERLGTEHYLCDIGTILSESQNSDGTWTYSTQGAIHEITDNWDFCGNFYEYYRDNFGGVPENPFENPEKFHCQMMIEAVNGAFGFAVNNSESYSDYETWNEQIEITEKFIDEIKESLNKLTESDIF